MNLATSLLALVLIGADGPGGPVEKGLRYDVRILEMPGVAWRGALHEALEPISHQGRVCAWTMPRTLLEKLTGAASTEIPTPRLMGLENTSTRVQVGHSKPFVSHLTRIADGPAGHAHAVALRPTIERAENSLKIQVQGRRLDQGVLAQVDIVDTHVDQMLAYEYKEQVQGKNGPTSLRARAEVPEVSTSSARGEWLIPSDEVLVVSLGLHTKADKEGKAKTVERLALVDVQAVDREPVTRRGLPEGLPPLPIAASSLSDKNGHGMDDEEIAELLQPVPTLPSSLPTPPTPRRNLPTAINHKGELVETKVPDAEPTPRPDKSAEPRPTPQSPIKSAPPANSKSPEPRTESQHTCRADGPSHSAPSGPGHDRDGDGASKKTEAIVKSSTIRIEPRISFEIRLSVPELPALVLPRPGLVLSHLDKIAAIAPLMEKAADSYLSADEENGAIRVLDLEFPLGKAVTTRVSVLIEREDAHDAKTDDSATPVRFEPVTLPTVKDIKIRKECPICPACPSSKSDDQTSAAPSAVKKLTLPEAIRMGLRHADGVAVLEAGSMSSPTMIAPAGHQTLNSARSNALRYVRSIEQQYWELAAAQAQCRVSDELLSVARRLREQYRDSWSRDDEGQADLTIERFVYDWTKAQASWKHAEMELRTLLGVPRSVPTLTAVTPPLARKIAPDFDASLNVMLTSNPEIRAHSSGGVVLTSHEACDASEAGDRYSKELRENLTNRLSRCLLEVDMNYRLYQTAKGLKDAAMTRLKEQDAKFRNGELSPDRYLDSMNRWASAIAQEADFLSRYNAALAALEETKGTLLERDGVKVVASKASKKEKSVVRTSFEAGSLKGRRAITFTVGPVWNELVSPKPTWVQIPLGPAVAVGLRIPPPEKAAK